MSAVLSTVQSGASALLRRALEMPRAGAVAGTLAALFLARALRAWYRLSHVPGPFWCGFSKYWMVRESLKGRQPYAIQEVVEEYGEFSLRNLFPLGPIWERRNRGRLHGGDFADGVLGSLARIGPNELVTDDPELLKRMMAVRSEYSRGACMSRPTGTVFRGSAGLTLCNQGTTRSASSPGRTTSSPCATRRRTPRCAPRWLPA